MMKVSKFAAALALVVLAQLPSALHSQEAARTIEIHARRFSFDPAEITVKKGETVTIHLISDDVPHSLLVKGLDINEQTSKGHPGDATFTAKEAGDFKGQCGRDRKSVV